MINAKNNLMKNNLSRKILRITFVVTVLSAMLGLTYFLLKITGWWEKLNSVTKLQHTILELGFWGRFVFVLLQFLQVTFIPLPSPAVVIVGSIIYGPFEASLLSLSGILLGSALAFFLGNVFGKRVVTFMVGEEVCKKWQKFLSRCKYSFVVMMLLPLFPDDVLCLVAGLTDMSWTFFMTTQFVTRPIGVFMLSYFSSGEIIPYSGWGLAVWAIIFVFALFAIYFSSKYSSQIEGFVKKVFSKKKTKV